MSTYLGPDKTDKRLCQCGHRMGGHGIYGHCWHWVDLRRGITCDCRTPVPDETSR